MDDKYFSDKSVTDKEIKAIIGNLKAEKAKEKKEAMAKARAAKQQAAKQQAKPNAPRAPKAPRANRAKLLVSIVNRSDEVKLKTIMDDVSVTLSAAFAGVGTARSAVLDFFGIGETEKTILLSLFPESDEDLLIKEIGAKMSMYLVGRGISFTIPLSGVSEIVANGLAKASTKKTVVESTIMTDKKRTYDLIICAVNAEYSDKAMEAARSAGAAGGTILNARMLDNKKANQFIGISLATEQEILLILTKREGKLAIMQALFDKVGVKTEAGGIIFSVPVDRTVGIGAAEPSEATSEEKTESKADAKKEKAESKKEEKSGKDEKPVKEEKPKKDEAPKESEVPAKEVKDE